MSIIFDYADIAKRMKGELAPKPKPKVEEEYPTLVIDLEAGPYGKWLCGDFEPKDDPPPYKPTPTPITRQILGKRKLVS